MLLAAIFVRCCNTLPLLLILKTKNMNAKEKAKELIEKYLKLDIEIGGQYDGYLTMKMHDAKECALIAVDEILNSRPVITDSQVEYNNFWNDVKSELQSFLGCR
jgi:hypothetical protein